MKCPFCDAVTNGSGRLITSRTHVFVVLSDPRLVAGHVLVVPKRHTLKLSELEHEEQKELFDTVVEFQKKIIKIYATGCDIRQNYRPFLKQGELKVDHIHIHLIPREFEDELYQKTQQFEKNIFQPLTETEREKFIQIFH
jgi:diadenosine tetraphosphate (Ap4A) HIT family hydrolase